MASKESKAADAAKVSPMDNFLSSLDTSVDHFNKWKTPFLCLPVDAGNNQEKTVDLASTIQEGDARVTAQCDKIADLDNVRIFRYSDNSFHRHLFLSHPR